MDKIEKVQIHKEYEKGYLLMQEFKKLVKDMEPWLDWANPELENRLIAGCKLVGMKRKKPLDVFLDCICEGNICHLKGADIEFIDRKDFWLTCREILINEEYFLEFNKENPVIYDCGTNIGLAIYYYKSCYPKAKVIGFEPWNKAYEIANRNVIRNNWESVTIHPYALSDKEGEVTFHAVVDNSLGGTMTGRCYDSKNKVTINDSIVISKKLSDFIEDEIDFIKMDIEGMEKRVLYDIKPYFCKIKHIFIEYHYSSMLEDNSLTDILLLLDENKFKYFIELAEGFKKGRSKRAMSYIGRKTSMSIYAGRNE